MSNQNFSYLSLNRYSFLLLMSAVITGLTACGGGGGGSSSTTTTPSTGISGQVIDGYITGAKVCLDVNSNNMCDAGEPSTTSGANGSYTLPAYSGSLAGLQVIAEVGPTAIDQDTGVIGTGNGYSLLAPAAAAATITPHSTMVSTTIKAGGGESEVSIGEALSSVSASTGIPVVKLVAYDYKAAGDTTNATVAAVTASALSQVTKALSADKTIAANLTAGQIANQSALQVQNKVLPQLVSAGKYTGTSSSATAITAAVTQAVTAVNLSGQIQNIIAATQSGTGSVMSMADLFKSGFVAAQNDSGDYINGAGARYDGPSWKPSDPNRTYWRGYSGLSAEYLQLDVNSATAPPPMMKYVLADNNKWYVPYEDGENWTFDGSSWVIQTDIGASSSSASTKPSFDKNCIIVPKNAKGTVSERYCAIEKKLDGQLMTKYIPSMCTDGPAIAGTCKTATFPAGSSAYDLTQTTIANLSGSYNGMFKLWTNNDGSWNGYCTKAWDNANPSCTSKTGTVIDFINWTKFPNVQWMGDSCNVPFTVQSYSSSTKKGVMVFGSNPTLGCGGNYQFTESKIVETSDFEVVTLGGKDVLIMPTPAIYRANNPSNQEPYKIFAAHTSSKGQTGVWNGEYVPTTFKVSIPFSGDPTTNTQIISNVLFDAVLKQKGITKYPYKEKSSSGTWNGSTTPSTDPN